MHQIEKEKKDIICWLEA